MNDQIAVFVGPAIDYRLVQRGVGLAFAGCCDAHGGRWRINDDAHLDAEPQSCQWPLR